MIDLSYQKKQTKKDDTDWSVGAVCGFMTVAWVIAMITAKLLGWL